MVERHLEPRQYVLDESDQPHWAILCEQADAAVRRGRRPRPTFRRPPKRSRRQRAAIWLFEHLAGGAVGVAVFVIVWQSVEGSVSNGHLRTLLAGVPAVTAWALLVLLIRWSPKHPLAFLIDS